MIVLLAVKFTPSMNMPTGSKRGTSLGLLTPTSFELQLLEVALKGKTTFETRLDEKCANYDVNMEVMCHEILLEIIDWKKSGSTKTLRERARALVLKMKGTSLHSRALVVYRDFLVLGRPPRKTSDSKLYQNRQQVGTECTFKIPGSNNNSQVRQCGSSQIPNSKQFSSIRIRVPSCDEKFDLMMNTPLPLSVNDDSSTASEKPGTQKLHGEPSTPDDILSCEELVIFMKPTETDEGFTNPCCEDELIFDLSLNHEPSDGESVFLLSDEDAIIRGSVFLQSSEDAITPGSEYSLQGEGLSGYDDFKRDLGENPSQVQVKLGNFPGKDFQVPITWTVDKVIHRASKLADLRSKHVVLTEGTFRKRCRTKIWRDYYGFFFDTGVMIYFRNKIYKKAADFRKCTVTELRSKPFRLIVQKVCVDTKQTDWHLEFDNAKHRTIWYETIVRFSKRMPPVAFSKELKVTAYV